MKLDRPVYFQMIPFPCVQLGDFLDPNRRPGRSRMEGQGVAWGHPASLFGESCRKTDGEGRNGPAAGTPRRSGAPAGLRRVRLAGSITTFCSPDVFSYLAREASL